VEPYPHGLPGLYAAGVAGLELHAIHIARPQPLPAGWDHESIRIDPANSGEPK